MIKTIPYKKKEIRIEVLLIDPPPPAHMDTVPRYKLKGSIWYLPEPGARMVNDLITTGWVYQKDVGERHLEPEIDIAEKEVKKKIDQDIKDEKEKQKQQQAQADKLTSKGFK